MGNDTTILVSLIHWGVPWPAKYLGLQSDIAERVAGAQVTINPSKMVESVQVAALSPGPLILIPPGTSRK